MIRFAFACCVLCTIGCGSEPAGNTGSNTTGNSSPTSKNVASSGKSLAEVSPTAFADIDTAINVLMTTEDNAEAGKAIQWLGMQKATAVQPLAAIMNDADSPPKNRNYACKALGVVGAPAGEVLLEALNSNDDLIRVNAAKELGRIKPSNEKTMKALVGLLNHEDWKTRLNALKGLTSIGPSAKPLAEESLLAIANSTEEINTVRTEAKRALKIICPRRTFND